MASWRLRGAYAFAVSGSAAPLEPSRALAAVLIEVSSEIVVAQTGVGAAEHHGRSQKSKGENRSRSEFHF